MVTDREFLRALREIVLWGDIDEIPIEDPIQFPIDREQELRALFASLLSRLEQGREIPLTVGEGAETVNRWVREQRDRNPRAR